nr:DUF992 domain-containing protein [Phyllobacterium sp. SYP-B3895]
MQTIPERYLLAETNGLPKGALAGTYSGIGANASVGPGAGANILAGGTGAHFHCSRSLSKVRKA